MKNIPLLLLLTSLIFTNNTQATETAPVPECLMAVDYFNDQIPESNIKRGLVIDTDIGKAGTASDENDNQDLLLTMTRFDEFKIEGLIGTNAYAILKPGKAYNSKEGIDDIIINSYKKVYDANNWGAKGYPSKNYLLSVTFKGAHFASPFRSTTNFSAGAYHLVAVSQNYDSCNRLIVDVWGPNSTIYEALIIDPTIVDRIELWTSGRYNRMQDQPSFDYISTFDTLPWVHDEGVLYVYVQPVPTTDPYPVVVFGEGNTSPQAVTDFRDNVIYNTPLFRGEWEKYEYNFFSTSSGYIPWGNDKYRLKGGDPAKMYIRDNWDEFKSYFSAKNGVSSHRHSTQNILSPFHVGGRGYMLSQRNCVFKSIRQGLEKAGYNYNGSYETICPVQPPILPQ